MNILEHHHYTTATKRAAVTELATPGTTMFKVLSFVVLTASVIDAASFKLINHMVPDTETSLTIEDFRRAKLVDLRPPPDDSEMYYANRFEGDIDDQYLSSAAASGISINDTLMASAYGNALRDRTRRWTNGRVPYSISSQFSQNARAVIASAIDDYQKQTCIQWSPKSSSDSDYVHIVPGQGCSSYVGRIGGQQTLNLGDGCVYKGIIMHEMMHAVGFYHEQSRADRDGHVTIRYENIYPGMEYNFQRYGLDEIDHLGTEYDYGSVMHYESTAFSKNGQPTIEATQPGTQLGQREGFSQNDAKKINIYYECDGGGGGSGPGPAPGPENCEDEASNCYMYKSYCDESEDIALYCKKTCNTCPGSGSSGGGC